MSSVIGPGGGILPPFDGTLAPETVSPNIVEQLKSTGVADVIVILDTGADVQSISASRDAAIPTPASQLASELSHHFTRSELSPRGALASGERDLALGTPTTTEPAELLRVYDRLGVILGTVNVGGLLSLQHHPRVKKVVGTPRLSLVRPVRQAAASPKRKQTWGIERLNVPALWNQGLSGIGIKVGHLDTGVDGRHPALRGAIADFAVINNRGVPSPEAPRDSGYHGTHTAGTIAGRPVANRHIGVAPGAALASAAVIEGGDVVARILGGLDWVLEQGVRIVSLSLGFRGWVEDFLPIVDLLRDRDVLPIVAVGNEGAGTSRSPGNYPKVLSVGALDKDDTVPVFSSSQAFLHETSQARRIVPVLVAPGVDVISAVPNGRYQSMDGTSMATPHIAGLAALLMEAKPDGSAADIERAIYSSCSHPESALTDRANHGLPDGVRALAELGVTIRSGGSRQRRNSSPTRPNRKRR